MSRATRALPGAIFTAIVQAGILAMELGVVAFLAGGPPRDCLLMALTGVLSGEFWFPVALMERHARPQPLALRVGAITVVGALGLLLACVQTISTAVFLEHGSLEIALAEVEKVFVRTRDELGFFATYALLVTAFLPMCAYTRARRSELVLVASMVLVGWLGLHAVVLPRRPRVEIVALTFGIGVPAMVGPWIADRILRRCREEP